MVLLYYTLSGAVWVFDKYLRHIISAEMFGFRWYLGLMDASGKLLISPLSGPRNGLEVGTYFPGVGPAVSHGRPSRRLGCGNEALIARQLPHYHRGRCQDLGSRHGSVLLCPHRPVLITLTLWDRYCPVPLPGGPADDKFRLIFLFQEKTIHHASSLPL